MSDRPPSPSPAPFPDDLALTRAARDGDPRAVELLARRSRCIPRILRTLSRRRGLPLQSHDLEDLAQEVAAIVLQKLATFSGTSTLESWIHGICHFQLMNRVRKIAREAERFSSLTACASEPGGDPQGAEAAAVDWLARELVHAALEALDPAEADVVRLKHFDDLSFTELADRLDISPNTAKSRYYRALGELQRRLARQSRKEKA